jgi:uncharacterized membrane protein
MCNIKMLDSDTLRPVIIAMALYLLLTTIVPQIVKKPTNIKMVDDEILYIMSQKGSLLPGVILIGIIVYATNYINSDAN